MKLRFINKIIFLLQTISFVAFEMIVSRHNASTFGVVVVAWILLPHFLLFLYAHFARTVKKTAILLGLNIFIFLLNMLIYYDSILGAHADAQGGLVLIFLPLWENLILLGLGIIYLVLHWCIKKSSASHAKNN